MKISSESLNPAGIVPPLALVYGTDGSLERAAESDIRKLITAYSDGINLYPAERCTCLFRAELLLAALQERIENTGGESDLRRMLFSDFRDSDRISEGSRMLLFWDFYIAVCRFIALEHNAAEEYIERVYAGKILVHEGEEPVTLDGYTASLLRRAADLIIRADIDHGLAAGFFESLNRKNFLPQAVKDSVFEILEKYDCCDGADSGGTADYGDSVYNDFFDIFFERYREIYSRCVTDADREKYPLYDLYVNCKTYFAVASGILNSAGYENLEFREELFSEIKSAFEDQIRDCPWIDKMCGYFYNYCRYGKTEPDVQIVRAVRYFRECISAIFAKYYKSAGGENIVDTSNFNQNFKLFNLSRVTETKFLINYENRVYDFYIFCEHSNSRSKIYFSFSDSSYCVIFNATSIEISLAGESAAVLDNVKPSLTCDLREFGLPHDVVIDSIMKTVAFEYKNFKIPDWKFSGLTEE